MMMPCEPPRRAELPADVPSALSPPDRSACASSFDACSLGSSGTADPGADVPACREGLVERPSDLSGRSVRCGELRLELRDAPDGCSHRVTDLALMRSELSISAHAPCVVDLAGLGASDVRVHLQGPVTVRIADAELRGVSISARAAAGGEPTLELRRTQGEHVVLGDRQEPFDGRVIARESALDRSALVAHSVELETVLFERTTLDARSLYTADAHLETARLDVGHAVVAASLLVDAVVRSCGTLLFVDTNLLRASVPPCRDRALRLYESFVQDSVLEGLIESDATRMNEVRFGLAHPTQLTMFAGGAGGSAFCAHTERVRFGDGAVIDCSSCEQAELLLEPQAVCRLPKADPGKPQGMACPPLLDAPACEPPLPERMRNRFGAATEALD